MTLKATDIETCLLPPGSKFEVSESFGYMGLPKGSTGFVSRYSKHNDRDYVTMSASIIKRGKSGKDRIECVNMNILPYYYPNDKDWMKAQANRIKGTKVFIINKVEKDKKDLLALDVVEYVGWALAYANFLHAVKKF